MTSAMQMQWLDAPLSLYGVIRESDLTREGVEALAHQGIVHVPLSGLKIQGREAVIACLMERIQREKSRPLTNSDLRGLAQQVRTHKNADEIYYMTLGGIRCADVIDYLAHTLRLPASVNPDFPYVIENRGTGWGQPLSSWDDLAEQVRNLPEHPHDNFLIFRELRLGADRESVFGRMAQVAPRGPASFIVEIVDSGRAQRITRAPKPSRKELRAGSREIAQGRPMDADLWGPEQAVRFIRGWLVQGLVPSKPDFHLRTVWESSK